MRNILPRRNFLQRCLTFVKPNFIRNFSKENEKDKNEEELTEDDKNKYRKGILHDKQQSIQEESYFHKEEMEQLKALKKKVLNKENDSRDKKNNKD